MTNTQHAELMAELRAIRAALATDPPQSPVRAREATDAPARVTVDAAPAKRSGKGPRK